MDEIKTCPVCGESFIDSTANKRQLYCSKQCRTRGWARKASGHPINDQERKCLFCNSILSIRTRIDKHFCNQTCCNKYTTKQRSQEALEKYHKKRCLQCAGPMPEGGRNTRKYCCSECAEKYRYSKLSDDFKQKDNERRQKLYLEKHDHFRKKGKEWYLLNKDKAYEMSKTFQKNNPDKFRCYMKKAKDKMRKLLPDHYVIDMIRKHDRNIDPKTIPQILIDLKRAQVQIASTLKEQNSETSTSRRKKR